MADDRPSGRRDDLPDASPIRLNNREAAIDEELSRIDPALAGLFREGVVLQRRVMQPGVKFMLGHILREITLGVVRRMAEESGQILSTEEIVHFAAQRESNRQSIARLLHLPLDHPVVDDWFGFQSSLHAFDHYSFPGPPPETVADAFELLKRYMFGRLGPYYDTRAELDDLLGINAPGAGHLKRLTQLLFRPAQRRYFFETLKQPGWCQPLLDGRFLPNAPAAVPVEGGVQPRPWPEGEYLRAAAPAVPDIVTEAIRRIPNDLDNPLVWHTVAEVATTLSPSQTSQVGRKLLKVARHPGLGRFFTPEPLIDLIVTLANGGDARLARDFCAALLQTVRPDPTRSGNGDEVLWKPLRWLLRRISLLDWEHFLERAVPALEKADGVGALTVLMRTLRRAVDVATTEGRRESSNYWCERLDRPRDPHDDDVRELLALAAAGVAIRLVERGEDDALAVWGSLEPYIALEIGQRLRLLVLARGGHYFQHAVSEFVASETALEPPFGAAETAAVLRQQFQYASAESRAQFVAAIHSGPADRRLDSLTEVFGKSTDRNAIVAEWQRQRLRWFHQNIPNELRTLAAQLGVRAEIPSIKQQALDEIGHHADFRAGSWGHSPSPRTAEELSALAPADIAAFLSSWSPDASAVPLEIPGMEGLEETLTEFAARHPVAAIAVIRTLLRTNPDRPRYLPALLGGLRKSGSSSVTVERVRVVGDVLDAAHSGSLRSRDDGAVTLSTEWRWAATESVDSLKEVARSNVLGADAAETVWQTATRAVVSTFAWVFPDPDEREYEDFEDVLTDSLNHFAGRATEAVLEVALWHYRALAGEADKIASPTAAAVREVATARVRPYLVPILDFLLNRRGRACTTALTQIGQYLPQLHLLARDWLLSHLNDLMDGGALRPLEKPVWGAYVTRARLYRDVFADLRPWYVAAAQAASLIPAAKRGFSPTEHLASHVTQAMIAGYVNIGDADALLELTFGRVAIKDRAHAYWELFRAWSDDADRLQGRPTERVILFWRWRLEVLAHSKSDGHDVEEEAIGLTALLAAPGLPSDISLELGERTVGLARGHIRLETAIWNRLSELSLIDIDSAFRVAHLVVRGTLTARWALLTVDVAGPVLGRALGHGSRATQDAARRLINELGERGYTDFGPLLSRGTGADA
jgi:hypothetical protein